MYAGAVESPYAARIRAARGFAGLSQEELAERLGVERQWVKRREGDYRGKPADRERIARACGVPAEFLENGWNADLIAGEPQMDVDTRRYVREWSNRVMDNTRTQAEGINKKLDRLLAAVDGDNTLATLEALLLEQAQQRSATPGTRSAASEGRDARRAKGRGDR